MTIFLRFSYVTLSIILILVGLFNALFTSFDINVSVILSVLGFALLFISFVSLSFRDSFLPLLIIISALIINVWKIEAKVDSLLIGIREMQSIVILVLIVPLIGLVLKKGRYLESMFTFILRVQHSGILMHALLFILSQIISIFLLSVTPSAIYQMIDSTLKNNRVRKYINITAIYRGGALAGIWVYSYPSFAFAVETFSVSILVVMAHGLFLAFIGLLLSTFFLYIYLRRNNFALEIETDEDYLQKENQSENKKAIAEFIAYILLLFIMIMTLNYLSSLAILTIISLSIIVWSLFIMLIKFNYVQVKEIFRDFFIYEMYNKRKEILPFLASGVLVVALLDSGIGTVLIKTLYEMTVNQYSINFLIVIPLIVLVLALFGVPPSASMVLVALLVSSIDLPFTNESIVIALCLGSVLSALISPLAIPAILLSTLSNISTYKLTVQMNYSYAFVFFIIVQLYVYILNVSSL